MPTYTDARLRACITTIRNEDANRVARIARQMDREAARAPKQTVVKTAVVKPAPKPAAKPKPVAKFDWRTAPASAKQVGRINRAERTLGYRVSPKSVIGTGMEARILWQSLKADARSMGIKLDCR